MRRAEDRPETAVEEVRLKFTVVLSSVELFEIVRIVTLNPHRVGFCHDVARTCQFTCCSPNSQGVHACFSTAAQTDASHVTT